MPKGNREAVRENGKIFEKFNQKNQLSKRGAWNPRQNNQGIQLDQFEKLLGMYNNDIDDDDI